MSNPSPARRTLAPARLLVDLNYAAKVWFGLFLLMAFGQAATLILLLRPRNLANVSAIFIASDGRGYGGSAAQLSALTNLHVRAAEDATQVLLNRHPDGFDQPERLPLLFLPEAVRMARNECEREAPERQLRLLHEKAQITRLQYLESSDQRILFTVRGQIIQSGSFNGQPLASSLPFQLDLELVPNPNLILQSSFPLVVRRYFRHENPSR